MKHLTMILGLAIVVLAVAGCDMLKKKAPEPVAPVEEVKPVEPAPPPEAVKPPAPAAETPQMAVAKEDIDRAVQIYKLMHDAAVEPAAKKEKYDGLLEEFVWDEDKFKQVIYDITNDPASRTYYNEQIAQ